MSENHKIPEEKLKDKRHISTIILEKKLINKGYEKKKIQIKKTFFDELLIFIDSLFRALVEVQGTKNFMIFMNAFYIDVIKAYPCVFEPLKLKIIASNIYDLPEEYITKAMSISVFSFFVTFMGEFIKLLILDESMTLSKLIYDLSIVPLMVCVGISILFYFLPYAIASNRTHSIETNMPFAINHMAAIASAGVPPETAFRMLVEYGKYGEFSNEIKKIVKRMNTLGEDLNKSVVYVLKTTPSDKFREFLYGMVSVVEGGGNINQYLKQISAVAMFDYKIKRKKYLESLSTFGDIYTVILITAPLFIIALLTIMNLVPSATVGGMDIVTLMYATTYVMIPFLNIAFLVFLYIIQPEI